MTVLSNRALAGLTLLAQGATDELTAALIVLGGGLAAPGDRGDLAIVRASAAEQETVRNGRLADTITQAHREATAAYDRLARGGCLLFLVHGTTDRDTATAAGLASLTRTLALEWAPQTRVNAILCERVRDATEAIALLGGSGGRMITGSVLVVERSAQD